jgi:hypothetical protein
MDLHLGKKPRRAYRGVKLSGPITRPNPGQCECCGEPEGKKKLCKDHDHETGRFRGWICDRDNRSLGWLGDRLSVFDARAALLRAYLTKNCPLSWMEDE